MGETPPGVRRCTAPDDGDRPPSESVEASADPESGEARRRRHARAQREKLVSADEARIVEGHPDVESLQAALRQGTLTPPPRVRRGLVDELAALPASRSRPPAQGSGGRSLGLTLNPWLRSADDGRTGRASSSERGPSAPPGRRPIFWRSGRAGPDARKLTPASEYSAGLSTVPSPRRRGPARPLEETWQPPRPTASSARPSAR